jgi:hypothetical protein
MRTKALTADERRYTQIGMIRRLLFTVGYYQGVKDTGTRPTDFYRSRDRSSERNLCESASICGSAFLCSLCFFAAVPSWFLS